ncbi:NifU family protein [Actinomyces procaprae]|uniref:NifU family protein n=1 Tax=Actinomyces procaprae TaxID=2560010 RepID=UPI0010A26CC4|nr:NifU family protein [Actinomyces procaprae]
MSVVPTHPLATPDPAVLRWVIPDGLLGFSGTVARAPRLLQALLDDGTLACIEAVPGAVLTLLGAGHSWQDDGARVRTALVDALGAPGAWEPAEDAVGVGPDEALEAAAREIAAGPVGAIAAAHGGSFTVQKVADGVVEVALEGACRDCPAAVITMHARFKHLLRRRCPWLVDVREAPACSPA